MHSLLDGSTARSGTDFGVTPLDRSRAAAIRGGGNPYVIYVGVKEVVVFAAALAAAGGGFRFGRAFAVRIK